jgi:hypothetical protein
VGRFNAPPTGRVEVDVCTLAVPSAASGLTERRGLGGQLIVPEGHWRLRVSGGKDATKAGVGGADGRSGSLRLFALVSGHLEHLAGSDDESLRCGGVSLATQAPRALLEPTRVHP